ncbi:hypothetical protein NE237_015805 [Protea cynaroides]|uniref:Uncharacterized protein n=1 Tax=Protea cynaroides TaxID=273540 RepID=A0A9Q0QRJ9_9MAGN|nr:hypothetical protein NE237_015805 [Protea cynaroides]
MIITLFNAIATEVLIVEGGRVSGVVTNWALVSMNHHTQSCMVPTFTSSFYKPKISILDNQSSFHGVPLPSRVQPIKSSPTPNHLSISMSSLFSSYDLQSFSFETIKESIVSAMKCRYMMDMIIKLFNAVVVEVLIVKGGKVSVVVTNWALVLMNNHTQLCMALNVMESKVVVSSSGHNGPLGATGVKRLKNTGMIDSVPDT